ncbi:MAG TPA: hypothetical protein VHM31_15325, partial [Polyangia bacterium]|nr:hypothetical protein [Polyangia bacterium]
HVIAAAACPAQTNARRSARTVPCPSGGSASSGVSSPCAAARATLGAGPSGARFAGAASATASQQQQRPHLNDQQRLFHTICDLH